MLGVSENPPILVFCSMEAFHSPLAREITHKGAGRTRDQDNKRHIGLTGWPLGP